MTKYGLNETATSALSLRDQTPPREKGGKPKANFSTLPAFLARNGPVISGEHPMKLFEISASLPDRA